MTIKMNPEAKAKIVAALRSGEYKQGRGVLNKNGCMCIWGVISDVSGVGQWLPPNIYGVKAFEEPHLVSFPPKSVEEWAGIKECSDPHIMIQGETMSLMAHNDEGATFDELADAIEEQL